MIRRIPAVCVVLVLLGTPWADAEAQTTTGAAESEFARKTKCFEVGRLLYKDLALPRETIDNGSFPLDPMYTYSKELNTCVAYFAWSSFRTGEEFLIDVLSNISIVDSIRFGADAVFSSDEFDRQMKAFFPDAP